MLKNYQGPNLAELLRQVKDELGPDAIIMDKRRLGLHDYELMVKPPAVAGPVAGGPALPAGMQALLPAEAEPAARAGQFLGRRIEALAAPALGPKQMAAVQPGRRVIDVMAGGRVLPPAGPLPAPNNPAARPLTYGATGTPVPLSCGETGKDAPARPEDTPVNRRAAGALAQDGRAPLPPAAAGPGAPAALGINNAAEAWQAIRALQGKMEEVISQQQGARRPALERLLEHLQEQDIAPDLARKLCAEFSGLPAPGGDDHATVCERLTEFLRRGIDFGAAVEPLAAPDQVLVLMGPTGVGKTTTAVKLAARYALTARRRVALLTIDTTRPGGGEELHRYAEVLHVPCEAAGTVAEAAAAWERLRDHEVVIIDTAGCPPRDQRRLDDLRRWLDALDGERQTRLLVMSATAKGRDLRRIAENFRSVRYDRFVFTKLDETTSVGNLYALLQSTRVPALYVTNGREVTGDLELLCPLKLARGICRTLPRF